MATTVFWLQCGACSGDSMSLLNVDSPDLVEVSQILDLDILWHPSLSNKSPSQYDKLLDELTSGEQELDVLCVEGSIIRGPGGTGMYDTYRGAPKKNLVAALAKRARVVVAVGTCASFGGIGSDGDIEATGLQWHKHDVGGFLGESFRSQAGLPVINLPGCPCHYDVVVGALAAVATGTPMELSEWNAPMEWYGMLVHQGCARNEYHEYRVEERDFGDRGCLFFHIGCRGPLAYGPCNKLLWNNRSSKTRAGVPCVGCTQPDFPQPHRFFETRAIADIPIELPDGVDRAHYLAYKGMAAAAAPKRLKLRQTRV
jgi:uptake hydrogenase small subunit